MTLEAYKALFCVLLLIVLLPLGRLLLGPLGPLVVVLGVGGGYAFYQCVLREWFE
jgi:hypothetical protein